MTPAAKHAVEVGVLVGGAVAAWWLLKQQGQTVAASYTPQYGLTPGYGTGTSPTNILSGNYPASSTPVTSPNGVGVQVPAAVPPISFQPAAPNPFYMVVGGNTVGGNTVYGPIVGGAGPVVVGGTYLGGAGPVSVGGVNAPVNVTGPVSNYSTGGAGCCTAAPPSGNATPSYQSLVQLYTQSIPGGLPPPQPTPGQVGLQPSGPSGGPPSGVYITTPLGSYISPLGASTPITAPFPVS